MEDVLSTIFFASATVAMGSLALLFGPSLIIGPVIAFSEYLSKKCAESKKSRKFLICLSIVIYSAILFFIVCYRFGNSKNRQSSS